MYNINKQKILRIINIKKIAQSFALVDCYWLNINKLENKHI